MSHRHAELVLPGSPTQRVQLLHNEEPANVRQRHLSEMEPAAAGWANVAPTVMQGMAQPRVRRFAGRCTDAEHAMFEFFLKTSTTRTIYFVDIDADPGGGDGWWQALVVSYEPTRRGVVKARNNASYVRDYTLEIEIVATAAA